MAGFTDPTGARFAVWQPGQRIGLDAVGDVDTLCWTELITEDPDRAKAFYRAVFDWNVADRQAGHVLSIAGPAGAGEDARHTGIMGINRQMREMGLTDTAWGVYFEVPDCDAIAALADAKGGSIVMPPITMEGVGRMALLADPFGARFSVITSA